MALAIRATSKRLLGRPKPRIAPPTPARSQVKEFTARAAEIGLTLYPWQQTAARYLTALGPEGRWLYPEVAVIVARQNGKTTLLLPLIVERLLAGRRVMHTAQNRVLPMEVHDALATIMVEHFSDMLPKKRGIRYGAGQEDIRLLNGGRYRIVAPSKNGARGPSNDDIVIDELREMVDFDFIAAAKPTLTASQNPQAIYLSNAGHVDSVVLNALRDRASADARLAYLEWSAAPERAISDLVGWAEANPALGHKEGMETYLLGQYQTSVLEHTVPIFETEHLCRWVTTMLPRLVSDKAWQECRDTVGPSLRPMMAINMDPAGTRASAVIAWQQADESVEGGFVVVCKVIADVTGDPIDVDRLGRDLAQLAIRSGVVTVGYASYTDGALARHFRKPKAIDHKDFCNGSENFVRLVASRKLRWQDADQIGEDLAWTARKPHESGAWMAVKAVDDRPATAALAAIRAVWLASGPRPAAPRVM